MDAPCKPHYRSLRSLRATPPLAFRKGPVAPLSRESLTPTSPTGLHFTVFAFVKLDIHHRSVPIHLEDFLADRLHFQAIKFGGSFTVRTTPTAPMDNSIF
ncbi:hypothetical protein AVEN_194588-1 [Araneus ventricosus]|uniref:Uncharacterized protein n=1 Tax=Araneus ventricosus TaxID=182803 RepID=A0A4Y2A7U8_ARAVE|nr:hypothetical protein AVEN_194588-1 [Araneus ventricosus]